jgi:putative hydrolase of the HAD superfamily
MKHYSFDLWQTIIRSNLEHRVKRAEYFYKNFNFSNHTIDEILAAFRQADREVNFINERVGKNLDFDEIYTLILLKLNGNEHHDEIRAMDFEVLHRDLTAIFFNYPPELYDNTTFETLKTLHERGSTMNILSNTGLIQGNNLKILLNNLNTDTFFDFYLFSDDVRLSKPNPAFFELAYANIQTLHPNIARYDIMHIGDNPIADIAGAEAAGFRSFLINSNDVGIADLIK